MITVKAYADLSKYLTNKTGKFTSSYENAQNPSVNISDILSFYKIPVEKAAIILINGKAADIDSEVNDGDTVTFFSPVGGG